MRVGIAVFPGSNCDRDAMYAFKHNGVDEIEYVWYSARKLSKFGLIILPGGFSFGDYLRTGAIAIHSEIFRELPNFVRSGGYVIGICNGFQMLAESKMLPGFLLRNKNQRFISKMVDIRIERNDTVFTSNYKIGEIIKMPIAHTTGNYQPIDAKDIGDNIVFRYVDNEGNLTKSGNPNGSYDNIAGIIDNSGHILGLMPHFERVSDEYLGNYGVGIIRSFIDNLE